MRFLVLGTSQYTLRSAEALIDGGCEICGLLSMTEQLRPLNSVNLFSFASMKGIPYYEVDDINSPAAENLLHDLKPDFMLSSWPKIIEKRILVIPNGYVIGTHPTCLPYNRGRHPLHWLIAMGFSQTHLSFFRVDEGIDTGNILLQIPIQIEKEEPIGSLVAKVEAAFYEGTRCLCKILVKDPLYLGSEQEHSRGNYWRMRTPHDVTLDLRMSADIIIRMVCSFTCPYPCANLVFRNRLIKIVSATLADIYLKPDEMQRLEPGRVLSADGKVIRVKVDDAIVDLVCKEAVPASLCKASYIHPPTMYLLKWPKELGGQL